MDSCVRNFDKCSSELLKKPGEVVKVGLINDSAYAYAHYQDGVWTPAYSPEVDIAKIICNSLGFNCLFTLTSDDNYFTFTNGSWGGFLGDLLNGSYDMSLPVFYPTELREKYFSFSSNALPITSYFVTRVPKTNYNHLSISRLLAPFKLTTWIVLCLVSLVVSLFIFMLHRNKHGFSNFIVIYVNTISLLIRKGQKLSRMNFAGKTLFHVWSTSAVIITAYYASGLLSSMISLPPKPPFIDIETLLECLTTEKCRLILAKVEDRYFVKLMTDYSSYVQQFKSIMDNHPPIIVNDLKTALNLIINTHDVYLVSPERYALDIDSTYYASSDGCSLLFMEENSAQHFMLRKSSSLLNRINKKILRLDSSGILQKIASKQPQIDRCRLQDMLETKKKTSAKPLHLRWIISVMVVSTCGFIVSFVCLLGELIIARWLLDHDYN